MEGQVQSVKDGNSGNTNKPNVLFKRLPVHDGMLSAEHHSNIQAISLTVLLDSYARHISTFKLAVPL